MLNDVGPSEVLGDPDLKVRIDFVQGRSVAGEGYFCVWYCQSTPDAIADVKIAASKVLNDGIFSQATFAELTREVEALAAQGLLCTAMYDTASDGWRMLDVCTVHAADLSTPKL